MRRRIPSRLILLNNLKEKAKKCVDCDLSEHRIKVVFGEGNINSPPLMIIGEAPGRYEDLKGIPFVGSAGNRLNKWIEFLELRREYVFIQNVVMCRPPKNIDPESHQIKACSEYFWKKIELIKPKIVLTVGKISALSVLGPIDYKSMQDVRGIWHNIRNYKVRCTYHPAYILRNKDAENKVFLDLSYVKQELKSL